MKSSKFPKKVEDNLEEMREFYQTLKEQESKSENPSHQNKIASSKGIFFEFKIFLLKLVRFWGLIFRFSFICFLGVAAYLLIDPESIGDIPLSQLTLRQIFENLFIIAIGLGLLKWLFSFPEQMVREDDVVDGTSEDSMRADPYLFWGKFGGVIIVACLGAYLFYY